jgi:hypothetical protein
MQYFPVTKTDFTKTKFSGKNTNFNEAKFLCKEITDFEGAKFASDKGTSFHRTHFQGEGKINFSGVQF